MRLWPVAQPPTYDRQYSFIGFQGSNPTDPLPADKHEIELNAIKVTLDAILGNLGLIQRDDGRLANLSVGNDQLEVSLRTGINPPTAWTVAPTAYSVNDTVVYVDGLGRSELWLAIVAHTSTADFDTDSLTSLYWRKLADFSTLTLDASGTSYDNSTSGLTATDVQAAIDELNALLALIDGLSDADKGDITVTVGGTVWTIDAGVITAAKLASDAVTTVKILDANVTAGKLATDSVTTAKINASAVTTAKIADNAITLDKMEHGTSGDILYYGASGEPFRLAKGTDGQQITLVSGLPAWGSPTNGWELVGTTYDFGVDGVLASVETAAFADGYEYRIDCAAVSHNDAGTPGLILEIYKATDLAYVKVADASIAGGSALTVDAQIYLRTVRDSLAVHSATGGARVSTPSFGEFAGAASMTAQKISKARISFAAGSIDAGVIKLYRRAV